MNMTYSVAAADTVLLTLFSYKRKRVGGSGPCTRPSRTHTKKGIAQEALTYPISGRTLWS